MVAGSAAHDMEGVEYPMSKKWSRGIMRFLTFVPWTFLVIQVAIVIASLLGYGIFTSRPDWLAQVDPQARFFIWAFYGFAIGNMLFGGLAVLADAVLRNKFSALNAFVALYALSL